MNEHLELPFYEKEFPRKQRGGGGFLPREDRGEFSNKQISKLEDIKKEFKSEKDAIIQYYDPNLIFKVKLNQKVDEKTFTSFMERRKIKIISSSPAGMGYWILLAEDEDLNEMINKLKDYGEEEKYKILDIIDSFDFIPPEEKIGRSLRENSIRDTEIAYLDLEIWRMEKEKLKEFLSGFKNLIAEKDGKITDELITDNLCLLRIKINKKIFEYIIKLREISKIDRPPRPYIEYQMLHIPLEKFDYVNAPKEDSVAIGVIDSGIISSHPLLRNAVGDEFFASEQKNKNQIESPVDDVGHGTKVASVALYGDIKKCIEERVFNPEIWILSAKIMYKSEGSNRSKPMAKYDDDELLEHQFERTINSFVENYKNCKVINISFGNNLKEMYKNERQFPLATLIDELAKKHNIIFVVSTGNLNWKNFGFPDEYPNYLINEDRNVKIIDPSSSAYAITVGSICQEYMPGPQNGGQNLSLFDQQEINYSPAETDYPSPFTRVGPGYKGMIKPELVETGGNVIITPSDPQQFPDISSNLILLNYNWASKGLFTVDHGTSYSAPKVAHHFAKLYNKFPDYSTNLIKALLISSAEVPDRRPGILKNISNTNSNDKLMTLLNIYGYGKPNQERASSSISNNILLFRENEITINNIHFYYFYLPREFIESPGEREISMVLVYDPPIRRNRVDYLGVTMETHLFRNSEINKIEENYNQILREGIKEGLEEIVPEKLKEIDLMPGVTIRSKSLHQKGVKIYKRSPSGINVEKPIVLVVICRNKWVQDEEYMQSYAVIVKIKHKANINLYNRIQQELLIRGRVRIRR